MSLGRLLCRLGLHRWGYGSAVDAADPPPGYTVVTYSWCRRKTCSYPLTIVDVEERWKTR